MTQPAYTRCPECQTIFHVTPAQLEARGGLVRCGICASAFQADQHLFDSLPGNHAPPAEAATAPSVARGPRLDPIAEGARTEPMAPPDAVTTRPAIPADDLPLMSEFPLAPKRRRLPTAVWLAGSLLLALLLFSQTAYFFAAELARDARLRPWLAQYCEQLGCSLRAPGGTAAVELAQTSVAPHPRYENALRLRAVLVNRTAMAQPYPLLEVSLTDSEGNMLARRAFTAAQYLEAPPGGTLAPAVATTARLDVTNADGKAVGYEIRLVTATE